VLEVRVHLDLEWDMLPDDYVLVAIDIGALAPETIRELPNDSRAAGDAWIASRRSALLRVPSWIVPESHNILINPVHPDAASVHLGPIRPFQFDRRLWALP
jgi:RES domain-containing protein